MRAGPALGDHDLGPLISARQKALVQAHLDRAHDLHVAARGRVVDDAPRSNGPTIM